MNFKGGYKLVDLKNVNLAVGTATEIKGTFSSIESNYRKPIVICGLTINGVEKKDAIVNFEHGENMYNGLLCMTENNKFLFITVSNDDNVTISEHTLTLA